MGMVYELEEMKKEINDILLKAGYAQLLSTQINATTALSVCIRPLTYDVVLGEKNIVSCNCPENAVTIYKAMMADFKGDIYNG